MRGKLGHGYIQAWVDKDGRAHQYFRRAGFRRVRLPGLPGSAEFNRAYEAALESAMTEIGARQRSKPGSVSAAIASYYMSPSFNKALVPETQQARRTVLEAFRRPHGDKLIAAMPRKFLAAMLDAMPPGAARNLLKAIRAMVRHCIDIDMLKDDPTLGIKLRSTKGERHTWSEEEIAAFEATHAIGSRERLAMALGVYTGQRRGDVVRMGRQHLSDCLDPSLLELGVRKMLFVRQQKTGRELKLPVHPDLQAVLDAVPGNQLTFLTTLRGKPFDGKTFTQWFAVACDSAGLPSVCTFHGLRKAACRRLAEAGCTVHEIAAISGHKSLKEVERYTRDADQARLAQAAMKRTTQLEKRIREGVKA